MIPTKDKASWRERGLALSHQHRGWQFDVADWLLAAGDLYKDDPTAAYDYAQQLFPQYARATFVNWAYVAKAFPASIRIDALSFGHHQAALAVDDPAARLQWLERARDERLSIAALRAAIIGPKVGTSVGLPDVPYTPAPYLAAPGTVAVATIPAPASVQPVPQLPSFAGQRYRDVAPLGKHTHNLDLLSFTRGVPQDQIVAEAVKLYLDSCADELAAAQQAHDDGNLTAWAQHVAKVDRQREFEDHKERRAAYEAGRAQILAPFYAAQSWALVHDPALVQETILYRPPKLEQRLRQEHFRYTSINGPLGAPNIETSFHELRDVVGKALAKRKVSADAIAQAQDDLILCDVPHANVALGLPSGA